MARTAAHVVFDLAGKPEQVNAVELAAACAVCGTVCAATAPYSTWQGANFTDQNKLTRPDSGRVCSACIWSHSWVAPPGYVAPAKDPEKPVGPGKPKGASLRMFTHLWDANGYRVVVPRAGAEISAWLRRPSVGEWFAAIADSGQKHVLPWTPINSPGASMVRFEEETLRLGDWKLLDDIRQMLAWFPRDTINDGRWQPSLIIKHNAAEAVRAFERCWSSLRGSAWWRLCLFLARKEKTLAE